MYHGCEGVILVDHACDCIVTLTTKCDLYDLTYASPEGTLWSPWAIGCRCDMKMFDSEHGGDVTDKVHMQTTCILVQVPHEGAVQIITEAMWADPVAGSMDVMKATRSCNNKVLEL